MTIQNSLLIASVVLTVIGLAAIFWVPITTFCKQVLFKEKKPTLKDRIEVLTGEINKHFMRRQFYEIKQTLAGTGRTNWFAVLRIFSVLLSFCGLLICAICRNVFFLPLFPVLGAVLPFLYVKLMANRYKNRLNTDLEDALFAVTYNYMTSDNFIAVIRDNLDLMAPTVQPYFSQFVTESTLITADVRAGLLNLKAKINNPVFHEWCDCVIQCQTDSTLKGNLLPIVERLSDNHVIQHEVDTLIAGARRSACYVLGLVCFCPLIFKIVPEWFAVYSTSQGKFSIALSVLILLFALWRIYTLSKPVELEEMK